MPENWLNSWSVGVLDTEQTTAVSVSLNYKNQINKTFHFKFSQASYTSEMSPYTE